MSTKTSLLFAVALSFLTQTLPGHAQTPWGRAQDLDISYPPAKVVFDLTAGSDAELASVLDRVSMLNNFYASDPFEGKIIIVIHGEAIPRFAVANYPRSRELMTRAASLAQGEIVEFRLCRAAARVAYGLSTRDFHGFIKAVPMADAEIIRLQHEGFAYMR